MRPYHCCFIFPTTWHKRNNYKRERIAHMHVWWTNWCWDWMGIPVNVPGCYRQVEEEDEPVHRDQHEHGGKTLGNHLWNHPLNTKQTPNKHLNDRLEIWVWNDLFTVGYKKKRSHDYFINDGKRSTASSTISMKSIRQRGLTLFSLEQQARALM